ncbi:hypothetical protein EDC94DRAFT_628868 [Helicostylum pulchrum]|nr:hypothetical protein EDC94DRAFT_628868 [Helicostylum pulchrum]
MQKTYFELILNHLFLNTIFNEIVFFSLGPISNSVCSFFFSRYISLFYSIDSLLLIDLVQSVALRYRYLDSKMHSSSVKSHQIPLFFLALLKLNSYFAKIISF